MERFPKIVNSFQPLNNFAKRSILCVWQCYEYASARNCFQKIWVNRPSFSHVPAILKACVVLVLIMQYRIFIAMRMSIEQMYRVTNYFHNELKTQCSRRLDKINSHRNFTHVFTTLRSENLSMFYLISLELPNLLLFCKMTKQKIVFFVE